MQRLRRLFQVVLWGLSLWVLGPVGAVCQEPTATEVEATAAAPNAVQSETKVEPATKEERTTFSVKLSDGGRTTGSAGSFEYQEGRYLLAQDGVVIKYRDFQLQAERVRVDIPGNLLTAEGHITLDEGPRRLVGETLEYDLETRTGKLTKAKAFVDSEYYFWGDEIAKIGDNTYSISDGVFTSCSQEVPSWSIHLSEAKVTIGGYAKIKNARLQFKKMPVFYLPYMVWPARTERTSGFLIPKPGYSRRRGGYLGLAYFQTMGRSADLTLFSDLYSESFFGLGAELRYRPSENSQGNLQLYFMSEPDDLDPEDFPINDPNRQPGDDRWKMRYSHETKNLWGGFRGVVYFEDFSDFDFQQDYERNVNYQSRSFIYSNAYLSRNFGQQSINILIDQRERILRTTVDVRRQLPEVEYRLRPTQLGKTPIYLSLQSSVNYFSLERDTFTAEYGRADIAPTLSVPLSTLSWLSAKLELGGRATYYTDSLNERRTSFTGESLSRVFPEMGLSVVGPSFSRIFNRKNPGRFAKFKHVVEPRVSYGYVGDFDDQRRISLFDEVDDLRPGNGVVVSLINRLLAKPADETQGGAFEVASFELSQGYNLDDQPGQSSRDGKLTTREGPLEASLRINTSQKTSLKADVTYNTLFNQLQSLSFSGSTDIGRQGLGLTWFTRWNPESGEKTSDQARVFTAFSLVPDRLWLDAQVSYDVQLAEFLQQRYFLRYQSQCYSLQFELRESVFREIRDRDFRFSITLKNVGTFLDLTGGSN